MYSIICSTQCLGKQEIMMDPIQYYLLTPLRWTPACNQHTFGNSTGGGRGTGEGFYIVLLVLHTEWENRSNVSSVKSVVMTCKHLS